jgi:predicted acylesterase/phospholipase RssA
MSYDIELMSIGEDIYPLLERSATMLNGVQNEFRFHLTPLLQRQPGLAFQRGNYVTSEIWSFLRDHKTKFGGNRPHIIAFVTKHLRSAQLSNIFGSHEAAEGLAIVTTFDAGQYVKEETRFISYYLVRYALSFINPLIKAHDEEDRKSCYFHRKMYKPEIRLSMDTGDICDKCRMRLDNPPEGGIAHRLSDNEREALRNMLQFVSGDLPHAIVMKGGGVKGLAFAGALLELEKHFWFDRHVGTSAGAIAAMLLAANYTPAELRDILLKKDFRDFMDAAAWKLPFNLLFRQGCYPGDSFKLWIAELITHKIPQLAEVPMSALNGALLYASRRGTGTIAFDSMGERKDAAAAYAARCSMSIPLFFVPASVDGRRVFDGGLRNNFPLTRFLVDHPRSNFIGLYLGKPDNSNRRYIGSELLDIVLEGEERKTVDQNKRNVVVIDTSPIGTVDFGLAPVEKKFLLQVGRAAALSFLADRNLDDGPSREDVASSRQDSERCRVLVHRLRRRNKRRRFGRLLKLIVVVVLAVICFFGLRLLG